MSDSKKTSHLGLGLMAGAIIGMAAGLFIQSKKGKVILRDAEKKALKLQAKLMKELQGVQDLTKDKYEEIVDNVTAYYAKSKDIAKTEIPEVKNFLLGKWGQIEKQMKEVRKIKKM